MFFKKSKEEEIKALFRYILRNGGKYNFTDSSKEIEFKKGKKLIINNNGIFIRGWREGFSQVDSTGVSIKLLMSDLEKMKRDNYIYRVNKNLYKELTNWSTSNKIKRIQQIEKEIIECQKEIIFLKGL